MTTTRVPALGADGWFTIPPDGSDQRPALIGQRCNACETYVFPPTATWCPNPACAGDRFERVELSRSGTVWSYTDAQYQPPAPYIVESDEFEPFTLAAVELAAEGLVVLGQVVGGYTTGDLEVGSEVELTLGPLHSDDLHTYLIWRWQPVGVGVEAREGVA